MCEIFSVWPGFSPCKVPPLRLRISLWFSNSRLAEPSSWDHNTQEVPRKVDWQDHGQRQQANHCHEQDDVALEGQVGDSVNATFATNLFIPAEGKRNLKLVLCDKKRDTTKCSTCRCDSNQSNNLNLAYVCSSVNYQDKWADSLYPEHE